MSAPLPRAPQQYEPLNEAQFRAVVERALAKQPPPTVDGDRTADLAGVVENLLAALDSAGIIIDNTTA